MKSSLLNMVVVLFCITAVTSAAVGFVHSATKSKIEEAKQLKKSNALKLVLPDFDNDPSEDTRRVDVNGTEVEVYVASQNGIPVGYAVESVSNGFGGEIKLMIGFDQVGNIRNIQVLEHSETPGLGAKITEENNPVLLSFSGKNPADLKMSVKKDGGDIDAITASTISSRAYVRAVEIAYAAYQNVVAGAEIPDSVSGATTIVPSDDNNICHSRIDSIRARREDRLCRNRNSRFGRRRHNVSPADNI